MKPSVICSLALLAGLFFSSACAQNPTHAPAPLLIMPLGDSITQGLFGGGYRSPLCSLLTNAGVSFK